MNNVHAADTIEILLNLPQHDVGMLKDLHTISECILVRAFLVCPVFYACHIRLKVLNSLLCVAVNSWHKRQNIDFILLCCVLSTSTHVDLLRAISCIFRICQNYCCKPFSLADVTYQMLQNANASMTSNMSNSATGQTVSVNRENQEFALFH